MSKQALIQFVEDQIVVKDFPKFRAGDTITVTYRIIEGQKERLQKFQGIVLKRSGCGKTATFTIRKISNNIGVERCFPVASPMIENIELNKEGAVRKSRIYYLRGLRGKKARIKEATKR
ncbi:MAG: 50S ribosomal protein L19 [Bacteroidales bacterium]|nr:50S ribosomal protein L19 [Bacteroidales bacterium]